MATQEVQRCYSNDGKLWVGMTKSDAYNATDAKVIELFNSANKDNDEKIDADELKRYNGPALCFNGEEFYPGLTVESCQDNKSLDKFSEIDNNPVDGVLSADETREALLTRKKELKKELKSLRKKICIGTGIGAAAGAGLSTWMMSFGCSLLKDCKFEIGVGALLVGGAVATIMSAVSSDDRFNKRKELKQINNILTREEQTKKQDETEQAQ